MAILVQTILDQATGTCRLAHQRHWQHPLLRLNQARLARARLIIAMPSAPPPLFADPPKSPPPGMARLFGTLDTNLLAAVQAGWPLWKTPGEGGSCPKRPCHDFGFNTLKHGARIDFERGSRNDDLANMEWNAWLNLLPLYSSCVPQCPSNLKNRGNAMEQAVGLAYAAATDGHYLSHGELDWTRNQSIRSSQSFWASCWSDFQKLGLGPHLGSATVVTSLPPPADPDPTGGNGAPNPPPPIEEERRGARAAKAYADNEQTTQHKFELRRWLEAGDGHREILKDCIAWGCIMPNSSFPSMLEPMGLSVGTFVPVIGMHPATPELDNCLQYEDHAEPKLLLHGTQWNCLARILSSGRLVRGNRPKTIGNKNKFEAFGVFLCDTAARAARYSPAGTGQDNDIALGLRVFLLMRCWRTKHYGDGQYICREPWVEICALILTSCHDLDGGQNCASILQEEEHLVFPIPHQPWFCSWDCPEPTVLSSLWEDFRWKPFPRSSWYCPPGCVVCAKMTHDDRRRRRRKRTWLAREISARGEAAA